jgi:hypothetical protein
VETKGAPTTWNTTAERADQERRQDMKKHIRKTVPLGELILAVFDKAAQYSADPREISRLATQTVSQMLWHAHQVTSSQSLLHAVS